MSETFRRHWFRFSLKALLIITALVATFLGYAQWRRQSIMREARALEPQGFTLLWQRTWADWIWPVVPKDAAYEYYELLSPYQVKAGSNVFYTEDEANTFYTKAMDRLRALGVEYVRLDKGGKPGDTFTSTTHGNSREKAQDEIQ